MSHGNVRPREKAQIPGGEEEKKQKSQSISQTYMELGFLPNLGASVLGCKQTPHCVQLKSLFLADKDGPEGKQDEWWGNLPSLSVLQLSYNLRH